MSTGAALLQAIIDEPDEDSLRLIYADWLHDHGEPDRAEFIRLEIDLHARVQGRRPFVVNWIDPEYQRPRFPATWARLHHKGRVFYTSLGHRDDVWKNATFQQILLGGLSWSLGLVKADVAPNLKEAAPRAGELPGTK